MKFAIILSMLLTGSAFAANGEITCSLTQTVGDKSTLIGEVILVPNASGGAQQNGYELLSYVSPICEPAKPCSGYNLTSIITKGEARMVIKGSYTNEETGKVIAGTLETKEDSATAACTVL